MTQAEIADRVEISVLAYQRYEKGDREPRARVAARIAQILGTTVEEIWDGNPIAKTPVGKRA